MSEFRASSIIDQALAEFGNSIESKEALRRVSNQDYRDTVAVSDEQGNNLTKNSGLALDLLNDSHDTLVRKYGEDVANNAISVRNSKINLQSHRDSSRSNLEVINDFTRDAGSAFVGLVGNTVGAATVRPLAWAFGADADEASALQAELTSFVQEEIQKGNSQHSKNNARFMGIQQELDMSDNFQQYQAEVNSGDSEFIANTRRIGRDFLDAGKNIAQDPVASQQLIAGALGSLGPSAALAKGAAFAASKGVTLLTTSTRANALASSSAAIATIGATEASGTYAETMNNIMGMSEEELSQSSLYAGLRQEGYSPQDARLALANMTAEAAFLTNLPAATAFGVLTRRFETSPIGTFKGSNMVDGLRQITIQGVEEGGQGASSAASQNFALDSTAGIETDLVKGVGQSAAEGFVGGLGQAGVAAVPATTVGTARAAIDARNALLADTKFNDLARRTGEAVSQAGNAVASGVRTVAQTASPAVAYAVDTINRTENRETRETVQDAINLNETIQDEISRENLTPEAQEAIAAPADETVSEGFVGLTGSNVVEAVAGITSKLSERGFRPSDEDTVFAAEQLQRLNRVASSLPDSAQTKIGKILSSKLAEKIISAAAKIDLNDSTPVGEITPQEVNTTVNVAKTNPANVNPDRTDQILEQSGENISDQDLKITRVASKISRKINDNVQSQIEIRRGENVSLSKLEEKPKAEKTTADVSRSIQAVGYQRGKKKLRSINDFTADIIQGVQSPNGTTINKDGRPVHVKQVAKELVNFVQHMANRVEALNKSYDSNRVNPKTGRLTGSTEKFRGLVDADRWIEAENWTGSPLTYHRGSPGSVAFAQQVAADADTAAFALETLRTEFPEVFDGLDIPVVQTLKVDTDQSQQENPTAIDEETPVSEEQNQNTETKDETSRIIEEEAPASDEQNQPYSKDAINDARLEMEDLWDDQFELGSEGNIGGIGLTEVGARLAFDEGVEDALNNKIKARNQDDPRLQIMADTAYALAKAYVQRNQKDYTSDDVTDPAAIDEESNGTETGTDEQSESVTDEGSVDSEEQEAELITDGETNVDSTLRVNPEFSKHFNDVGTEGHPKTLSEFLTTAREKGVNEKTLDFVQAIVPVIRQAMADRLQKKVKDGGKTQTVLKHIQEGRTQFRRFKAGLLVDPETGTYDQNLLDLASVAMADWLLTNTGSNPNRLEDTLEKLGVSLHEISDADFDAILKGVPPSNAADTLASDILRMWDMKENLESGVGDLDGVAQGFAKEIFSALSDSTDLLTVEDVTLLRDGEEVKTQTILVQNEALKDIRKEVQAANGVGVKMTSKEGIFGDNGPMYKIGEKIQGTANTQSRSNVALSGLERRALKKMQDTGNFLDAAVGMVLASFGEGGLQRILGYREDVETIENEVLRRSVRGKNASILSNIDETVSLVEAIPDAETPVYFPVGVTKVGRHQYQGPNPQSNKLMRSIVTPTWSTVAVTNLNNFWIAVGQASDISGINKAEKLSHADIVAKAPEAFYTKYGPAVALVKAVLQGGDMDTDAFIEIVGVAEPQQLKAIIAVAQLEIAVENGDETFRTSLSFELDGLTNGVANMMVNFGQGELTQNDYFNFKRVGLFLGKVGHTVNDYFAQDGALDMYETTSRAGDKMMWEGHGQLEKWQVEQRKAAGMLSTVLGSFEIDDNDQFHMTRNTSKNPMTKVNYGSGVRGVAVGVADDMLLTLYEKLQDKPAGVSLDDYFYPGFAKDMDTMGLNIPADPSKSFVFNQEAVKKFQTRIQYTVGEVLTEATKSVIGEKINELNDMMVFSTNVQSQYLRDIYDERLAELGELLAKEGVIGRTSKGIPQYGQIPRKHFRALEKELSQLAPIFVSDEQTLAIGGFAKQLSNLVTSSNYDERLNQKARMPLPDDVGVKAIPFSVIGSGDAMMMNLIFGSEGAPNDVLGIFDGLDVPLDKIQEYAPYVNEQVAKSWDRDVLSMAIMNFDGFLKATAGDSEKVLNAFKAVADKNKNTSVVASNPEELMVQLNQRLRENQARKKVFKDIAISVDQMGGSNIGYTRDGAEVGLNEINTRIARVLEQKSPDLQESVTEPVFESTADAILKGLRFTPAQKKVLDVIRSSLPNTRVVMGTVDQLRDWRNQNIPDDGVVLADAKGMYDATNDIIFLTTSNPETVLHEMVHAATYSKVLDHYNGQTNDAVTRMEDLMQEFLDLDGGQNVRDAQAAILRNLNQSTPEKQASAVNEFMAYALTNSQVSRKLKDTQAKMLANLKSKVIRLLRRLMGGIPEDMFSHVVFNTKIIVDPPLDTQEGGDGGNGDGGSGNGELTPTSDNYTNYWIQQLADYIDSLDISTVQGKRRRKSTAQDILNADKVLNDLRQAGLLRNPEDRQTFRAIYGILKSEMALDPNSLIALTKVFQHVEENMSPEMFGSGSEANNTYSSIINSFGGFQNGDTSDAVAVLFALSQTSSKFRDVMEQIPAPETQAPGSGLNAFLARGTNIFMKKLMGSLNDGAPVEVLDGLKQTLIEADREKEYAILRKVTNTLTQADNYVSGKFTQAAEFMRKTDREQKEETANTVRQYLISAVTFGTNFLDRPGSELNAEVAQRSVHMGLPVLSIVPIRELVDEFVGTNRENKDFVAMMDVVNTKISGLRQAFREQLPGILNKQFTNEPTKEQWKSMQRTLAASDFTSVVDVNNMQRSMQLLEERGARQSRIQSVEQQLQQKLVPYVFQDAKDKAKQLAGYMNGQGAGKLLVRNAYAIAKNLDGNFDDSLVPLIDELTTLYAIDGMDAEIREETVQMWQSDPQAITAIVSYIQGLNEAEDQKAVSEAAKLNGYKGFIPNIGKDNHRVIVALDSEENDLIHQGYKKVTPFEGDVDSVFPRSYYVTNISQQGMYSQGIMQNVASTYRGVDVNTGLSVTGNTAGFISGDGSVERIVEKMNDESYVLENEKETMIPVFDGDGSVMGFERTVSPNVADAFLGREENLAVNLGAWAGRHVEEEMATQYNRALVEKLDDLYQSRETGNENQFVNLKTTKDPIYKESFSLIPQEIKAYADGLFDGTGMMVPESMVNLSVGYREASVADLWTGKTRMPKELVKATRAVTKLQFGNTSLRTLLVKGESIGQGIISDAKDIIVVKSLVVPIANTQANVIQLAANGVPVKTVVKQYRSKLAEITEFNKNVTKLIELRAQQRLTSDARRKQLLADKIQVIEDLNAKMTIAPMIAAGAYKQLSEGITDVDVAQTSGGLANYLEGVANKLPDTLGAVMKNGLVSKSTSMYQAANRATQYGDFLAKSIYYDHLLGQGLSEADAVARMNEEFVNFSFLPGRVRSALERSGLSWFMAFKIRIAKIAARQMRDNPVRALAINSTVDVGSPIQDNIFTVIGEGRLDYATGYEMLFAAPELNPWVNLMSN